MKPASDPAGVALAQEIRAHVKGMPGNERGMFALKAAQAGDLDTMRALLSAPSYLHGIRAESLTAARDTALARAMPDETKRLAALERGRELDPEGRQGTLGPCAAAWSISSA
jgi:hypothetical protein